MKPTVVVLVVLAGAISAILALGGLRWRVRTADLVARLQRSAGASESAVFDARELDGLPPPVARYLHVVLPDGAPLVRYARLEQRGRFLLRPTPDGWRPFTATEHFATRPPGFVWDARIRMAPGMQVMVRDGFVDGEGSMIASLLGVRRVASIEGTPGIAAGALQRYLAEAVWLPTALLPSAGVAWSALGPASARARLSSGDTAVWIDFHFGADGLVDEVFTPARERDIGGGRTAPTPWRGRFSGYEEREGIRIPLAGEVEWLLPGGPQPYWRGEIVGVTLSRLLSPSLRSG